MKRKSIKKALTAIMAATLIFTSSGFESIASAAEVKVQAVYTTFEKAALSVGETRQIKTYTEPENASNKEMEFSSSNENVATVSDTGLVTAVASGTANIKVKATDGSGEYETVKITVVKSVTIDNKSVDSDNDVILLDNSYADVTIKKSVGNANIYLSKVNVKGKLTLEDGNYKVYIYDSSLNNVIVDKAQTNGKIASMALDTKDLGAPFICMSDNTRANDISAYINSSMQFAKDSTANHLIIMQKYSDLLNALINGYTGSLNVTAAAGQVDVRFVDSILRSATVSGGTGSTVNFSTEDKSKVAQLTAAKQVKLAVALPADDLLVDSSATGSLTVSSPVGTLTNNGSGSTLSIDSTVNSLLSTGANAKITIGSRGSVAAATLSGAGTSVAGSGVLKSADIRGNNCIINTAGTAVKVGNVTGTMAQGLPMNAGETGTTVAVAVGGGGGTSTTTPTKAPTPTGVIATPTVSATSTPVPTVAGTIVKADFEDGTLAGLTGTLGTGLDIVNEGYDGSTKSLKVTTASTGWGNPGFDLLKYAGKKVSVITYMKDTDAASGQKIGFTLQQEATSVNEGKATYSGDSKDATSGWTKFAYTFDIPTDATRAYLYFEQSYQQTVPVFYLDRLLIFEGTMEQAETAYAATYPKVTPTPSPTPSPSPTPADKLMFSADFEDGTDPFTVASWSNPTTNTPEHNSGKVGIKDTGYNSNKSLLIDATSMQYINVRGIGYHFAPTASTTYRITARIKNAIDEAGKKVHFIKVPGYSTVVSAEVNNKDWTLIDMTITLDAATDVWLSPISETDGAFSYYVDDFKVYEMAVVTPVATPTTKPDPTPTTKVDPTPAIDPAKVIAKADFEDGALGGLSGTLGTGLDIIDGGNNSSKCLKVTTATKGWGNPGIQLKSYAGKTVTAISYVKNTEYTGQKVAWTLQLASPSTNGGTASYKGTSADGSGGWTKLEYTWDIPSDATNAYLYYEQNYDSQVPVFSVDRVFIYQGTQSEAEAAYTKAFTDSTTPATGPAFYMADLSKVTGVTYSSSDGSLTVTNAQAYVNFKDAVTATGSAIVAPGTALNATLATGSAINVTVTGKYTGTGGFRFYLSTASGTNQSGVIGVNLASDNTSSTLSRFTTDSSGNFNITITLTATNGSAVAVLFKGPSGGVQSIDNLTINSVKFVSP